MNTPRLRLTHAHAHMQHIYAHAYPPPRHPAPSNMILSSQAPMQPRHTLSPMPCYLSKSAMLSQDPHKQDFLRGHDAEAVGQVLAGFWSSLDRISLLWFPSSTPMPRMNRGIGIRRLVGLQAHMHLIVCGGRSSFLRSMAKVSTVVLRFGTWFRSPELVRCWRNGDSDLLFLCL